MGINVGTAEGYFDIDISSLQNAVISAVKELEKLQRQDKLVESGIVKLEDVVRSAAGGFANVQQKVKSLSAQIDSSKKQINIYEEGIKGLNEIIQRSGKAQDDLSKKIKEVSDKYQESEKKVKTLKAAYSDAKITLKEVTDAHGKESEQAQAAVKALDDAKKSYEKATEKSNLYRNELLQLETKHESLGNQITGSKEKIDEFSTKINIAKTDIAKLTTELKIAENGAVNFGLKAEEVGDKWVKAGDKISKIGNGLMLGVSAPIFAAGYGSFKAASDFESAWAGVTKTVDGTSQQMDRLRTGIIDMSQELPSTTTEISAVAESAGQLGIQTDKILGFTKTIIDLGNSTNLAGEEGAASLAKFANITGMSQDNFDRLGAAIVDLGNNFATTEADIVEMAMRLSGAGHQIGLSEGSIMGLAAALSSVGIEAEMGGSAFSKAMVRMQVAVETGLGPVQDITNRTGMSLRDLQLMSENSSTKFAQLAGSLGMTKTELQNLVDSGVDLQNFADVAGVSAEEFADAFEKNAVDAIQMFIHGLGDTENAGESTIKMLQDMGFTEVRLRDTMTRLANSGDLVTRAVETGNKAWDENTALVNEANKRYATTDSKLKIAKNTLSEAGRTIGEELLPVVADVAKDIANAAKAFSKLDPETKKTIIKFAAITAATGPLIKGIGGTVKGIGALTKGFGSLVKGFGKKAAIESATAAVGEMGSAAATASGAKGLGAVVSILPKVASVAGPIGIATGAVVGLGVAMHKQWEQMVKDDLEGRFGNIALSIEQIEEAASRITTNPDVERAKDVLDRVANTNGKFQDLKVTLNDISSKTYSARFGVEMEKEDIEDVKSDINSFISQGQDILKDKRLTVALELEGLNDNISEKIVGAFSELEGEFTQKGKELRKVFDEAFADGKLDANELETAANLQKEMTDILGIVSQSRYEVDLRELSIDGDLTPESYSDFLEKANEKTDEAINALEEAQKNRKYDVNLAYKLGKISYTEMQEQLDAIEKDLSNQKIELAIPAIDIKLGQVKNSFRSEMSDIPEYFKKDFDYLLKDYTDAFSTGILAWKDWTADQIIDAFDSAEFAIQRELSYGMDADTIKNAKDYYDKLRPTKEQLESIVKDCEKAGKSVPQAVLKGLSDINTIGAIANEQDAIWYLMGEKYGDNPRFQMMLKRAEAGGAKVNEYLSYGIYSNGYLITEAAENTINNLRNTSIEKISNITPSLLEALASLGFNTAESFATNFAGGIDENIQIIRDAASGTITAFKNTVTGKTVSVTPELLNLMKQLGYDMNSAMGDALSEVDLAPPKVETPDSDGPMKYFLQRAQGILNKNPLAATIRPENIVNGRVMIGPLKPDGSFATGGVFNSRRIIEVAEAGPEAVVPLADNAPWIDGLASSLTHRMAASVSRDVARQISAQEFMVQHRSDSVSLLDYHSLAQEIHKVFREHPIAITPTFIIETKEGTVLMDGEAVGKMTAPTVSRIIARKSR